MRVGGPAGTEEASVGLFCSLPAPAVVEMIGWAGFDFVILDAEHTLVGPSDLAHLLRAAAAVGLPALVRVPSADSGLVAPVLDAGAAGVVIPRVRSKADAEAAMRAVRYHPLGHRGLDAGRATRYGQSDLGAFVRSADAHVLLAVMVEDREGVEAIDDIVAVPGLDAVLEGAADLSQSLGLPWETGSPAVQDGLERVQEVCAARGLAFWAIPRRSEDTRRWLSRGVGTFVAGEARSIAARALGEHLHRSRGSIGG